MNTVHLTAQTDRNYLIPTAVMLTSAKENMAADSCYHVHLFHSDLTSWEEQVLQRLSSPRFRLTVVQVSPEDHRFKHLPNKKRHGKTALIRLNLPHLLPEVDKVLYLDGDILVLEDLAELYNTEMGDYLIAAVKDCCHLYPYDSRLEHFPAGSYICSGVALMNLAQMRAENTEQRFLDVAPEVAKFCPPGDQNILNYACAGRILHLHPRYDWLTETFSWANNSSLAEYNKLHGSAYESLRELEDDCAIVHIAGQDSRPWKLVNGKYSPQWMAYFQKSPVRKWCLNLDIPSKSDNTLQKQWLQLQEQIKQQKRERYKQRWNYVHRYGFSSFLTILKVRSTWNQETNQLQQYITLFGFIPLFSVKGVPNKRCWRLFHFIPCWKVRFQS